MTAKSKPGIRHNQMSRFGTVVDAETMETGHSRRVIRSERMEEMLYCIISVEGVS